MSAVTVTLDDDLATKVRDTITQLIGGRVDLGSIGVNVSQDLRFRVTRESDHVRIDWVGKLEADLPGPVNPDMLSVRSYPHETYIDLRLSNVRIKH